jgi:hypothetical protein
MNKTITKEEIFRCSGNAVAISATTSGYTLNYSVDGNTWTAWGEATPANEACVINGVVPGMYFKLVGNTDEITVIA